MCLLVFAKIPLKLSSNLIYFWLLSNDSSGPPVWITLSDEFVSPLSNPLVGNPLDAVDDRTGGVPRRLVNLPIRQHVVPEYGAVLHWWHVGAAVQKRGAPPKLQLWHVDEHGRYSVAWKKWFCLNLAYELYCFIVFISVLIKIICFFTLFKIYKFRRKLLYTY